MKRQLLILLGVCVLEMTTANLVADDTVAPEHKGDWLPVTGMTRFLVAGPFV